MASYEKSFPWKSSKELSMASVPRLCGDGMDSEYLLTQDSVGNNLIQHDHRVTQNSISNKQDSLPTTGSVSNKSVIKHNNLSMTTRETTVSKVSSPKYIPHEPVKGAVRPVQGAGSSVGQGTGKGAALIKEQQGAAKSTQGGKQPSLGENLRREVTIKETKYGKSEMAKVQGHNAPVRIEMNNKRGTSENNKDVTSGTFVSKQDTAALIIDMETLSNEPRMVEGGMRTEVEKLQLELNQAKADLEMQAKVNSDLKKLLVASVGDDLHCKVESLVRTKVQLASDIGDYTKKLYDDCENLEQVSIQADMWRSKFMASRLLVEQLSNGREGLEFSWLNAQETLKMLLQERQQLYEWLHQTHRHLKLLRDSFDPKLSQKLASVNNNILDLTRTNLILSEGVKFRLLGNIPVSNTALDAGIQNGLTPAEELAYELVSEDLSSATASGKLTSPSFSLFPRFHQSVRYENITYNCCAHCKGEIQVI